MLSLGLRLPSPLLGLAAALAATLATACGDTRSGRSPQPVSVFTHNLYLGTDFTVLLTAPDPASVPPLTAKLWANVQASNYPERAKVLAAQIVEAAPDLVALQEVSLYRRQEPSDFQPGASPNATEVVLDFLATLMTELEARGGHYVVAGSAENADVEVPVAGDTGAPAFDLRLTDRDVILARAGVTTSELVKNVFPTDLTLTAAGAVPLSLVRSTSHLTATVGTATLTFGNTHLEVQSIGPIHAAQAKELVDIYAGVTGPLIVAGDYNTEPADAEYKVLTSGLTDAWVQAGVGDGFTCCQADDLRNPTSAATQRIDHILFRGGPQVESIGVVGTDPATGRTPDGLWPTDHFAVRAGFTL